MKSVSVLLLLLVYLLATDSWEAYDVLIGGVVASLALHRFHDFVLPHGSRSLRVHAGARLLKLVRLGWEIAATIGSGAWLTVRLGLSGRARPGFTELRFDEGQREAAELAALLASMSPDAFLVDTDERRRVITFHVIDADAPERFRSSYERLYRRHIAPLYGANAGSAGKDRRS